MANFAANTSISTHHWDPSSASPFNVVAIEETYRQLTKQYGSFATHFNETYARPAGFDLEQGDGVFTRLQILKDFMTPYQNQVFVTDVVSTEGTIFFVPAILISKDIHRQSDDDRARFFLKLLTNPCKL